MFGLETICRRYWLEVWDKDVFSHQKKIDSKGVTQDQIEVVIKECF